MTLLTLGRSVTLHSALGRVRLAGCARPFASEVVPVPLKFDKLVPPNGNETEGPLVIMHGFFGMKRNWQSLSKAFLHKLNRPIYVLDLRNHGASPHAEPMTYHAMADDILAFCHEHALQRISLLGHSMGGKVAMSVALDPHLPENLLSHLIVADIAPSKGPLSSEFQGYLNGMKKIEESNVTTRAEAQSIMKQYEPDPEVRAFLLTNLEAPHDNKALRFKVPLDILSREIDEIGSFPYEPGEREWTGPSLFVKGSRSKYINRNNLPIARQFFPSLELETLETGHWVHAEKPREFLSLVTNFINRHH